MNRSSFVVRRTVVAAFVLIFSAVIAERFANAQPPATNRPGAAPAGQALPAGPTAPPAAASPGAANLMATDRMREAEQRAGQALAAQEPATDEAPLPPQRKPEINLWQLANDGGPLMYPIYAMSVVVVCFAFERWFGLRRRKLLPPGLVRELKDMSERGSGVDPRAAYRACQKYPSTAATVLKAVLLKIGRPHSELEQTLKEVNEREAARLYKNVRPMELAISVAPLLGLLGTVQGMIMAFFVTANADLHANKAEQLAQGIYVALVTTFAGLVVAIPAAMLAHFFEGKIQTFFRDLDEVILNLLPQWERYEGKVRVSSKSLAGDVEPPPVEPNTLERQAAKVGHA
jgi:biopolymer transport protein ExbB